jgi:peptidoglycan/LPS O-acetylase OafA/YrhL
MPPARDIAAGRFALVDALRGIAALSVVLFHLKAGNHIPGLQALMPTWVEALVGHGDLGVAIFFVLSGFVIAHSLYKERATLPLAGRFMLRRSIRLDPPYWVAIALALGSAFLSAIVLSDKIRPEVSWQQIAAHVLYLQNILRYSEINDVFWTLCLELQFYLIYVLMLVVARNNLKLTLILLFAAMGTSAIWPMGIAPTGLWPGSFLPLWHGFLLGAGAYWAWRHPGFLPAFALFALLILVSSSWRANMFPVICVSTACLLLASAVTGQISLALNWRWLQFLGLISYSLYLIHNPITGATFRVGYMLTGRGIWSEAFWFIATLAACVAAAAIMWWLIERPSLHLARIVKLNPRRQHSLHRGSVRVGDQPAPHALRDQSGGDTPD